MHIHIFNILLNAQPSCSRASFMQVGNSIVVYPFYLHFITGTSWIKFFSLKASTGVTAGKMFLHSFVNKSFGSKGQINKKKTCIYQCFTIMDSRIFHSFRNDIHLFQKRLEDSQECVFWMRDSTVCGLLCALMNQSGSPVCICSIFYLLREKLGQLIGIASVLCLLHWLQKFLFMDKFGPFTFWVHRI